METSLKNFPDFFASDDLCYIPANHNMENAVRESPGHKGQLLIKGKRCVGQP